MNKLKNKAVLNTRLILSKKQLYVFALSIGLSKDEALEYSIFMFENPNKANEVLSNFCSTKGEDGSYVNHLFNLGLLIYAKKLNVEIDDTDVYYDYMTEKKPIINNIDIDYVKVNKNHIDTYENMLENGLTKKWKNDNQ